MMWAMLLSSSVFFCAVTVGLKTLTVFAGRQNITAMGRAVGQGSCQLGIAMHGCACGKAEVSGDPDPGVVAALGENMGQQGTA